MDRRPQSANRHSMGRRRCRPQSQTRGGIARASPDVILANATLEMTALLQQATRSVPLVFANVVDPVGQGFVTSLARPGGNMTGFTSSEFGQSGKWLELLKEITPRVMRAAVLVNRAGPAGIAQFGAIQAVAPSLGVEISSIDMRDASEIEHAVTAFAHAPNGGLILTGGDRSFVAN